MLIIIFKLITSFFVVLLAGKSFLLLLDNKKNRCIIFFCSGLIIVSQVLFYLSLLGIKYNYYLVNGILFVISILIIISKRINLKEFFKFSLPVVKFPKKLLIYLLGALIIFQIFFIFSEALIRPVYSYDSLANWAWKTKVFSSKNIIPLDSTNDYYLGEDHANYPLFIPLIATWFTLASDTLVKFIAILSSIFFSFSIFYLFFELRKRINILKSLTLTLILAISPLFIYHGFNYYADLIFSFFILATVASFYNYFKKKDIFYFNIALLFSGALVLIKNAGLFFSFIILFIGFLYFILNKIKFKKEHVLGILLYLLLALPWVIFKSINKLGYSNSSESSFLDFTNIHFDAIIVFTRNLIIYLDFLFFPFIFIALIVYFIFSNIKNIKRVDVFPSAVSLFLLLAYIFIYIFTDSYNYLVDGTLSGRNLLTLWPLIIYSVSFFSFASMASKEGWSEKRNDTQKTS